MKTRILVAALVLSVGVALVAVAGVGPPAERALWADGQLYATVITPTELPDHGPKDGLYKFTNLQGQRSVAEAKPGDRDYHGGRWQVYLLAFTPEGLAVHDTDEDGVADFELTSWEEVQQHIGLGHLEMTGLGPSFVCPLISK